MKKEIKITKKEIMKVADYKPKPFPKYTASLINMLNRWAGGTRAKIVGQMSDLVPECPHKDYEKWKGWYLKKHPEAIDNAVKKIMQKLKEVKEQFEKIDENIVRMWVEDLVIDKSFWGLKIQEAILLKLQKMTDKKCRLAIAKEEQQGIDGFVGEIPVQIKPDTRDSAPATIKTEKLRVTTIFYKKNRDGDYIIDISELGLD